MKTRLIGKRTVLFVYWTWLTIELLLSDPWAFLSKDLSENPPIDTHSTLMSLFLHMSSFTILGVLLAWNFGKIRKAFHPRAYWFAGAYAISTEILQIWVPRRWPSVEDVVFNLIGLALGYIVSQRLLARPEVPASETPFSKAA